MEKYIRDGCVGVLVSGGYGAGWSTWNEYGLDLATDKRIIEYFLNNFEDKVCDSYEEEEKDEKKMKSFLESIGYKNVYCGGLDGLRLELVEKGSSIKIDEYDGFESLKIGYSSFTTI